MVLVRDVRAALERLNPDLPASAREQAIEKLERIDFARSLLQHNREFYGFIRGGVPVEWRDAAGETRHAHAQVIDFRNVEQQSIPRCAGVESSGRAGAALQPACGSRVLRERPAAGLHRTEGGLSEHPRRFRRQPHRLSDASTASPTPSTTTPFSW